MTRRFQDERLDNDAGQGWAEATKGLAIASALVAVAWVFGPAVYIMLFGR
ncbi:hypothetical protein P3G55_20890 [Leptospira sp. 96542]|nr:hypothetical protein [Leptospira sp. 96542]